MTARHDHPYDEFGLFAENIAEHRLSVARLPTVERVATRLADGRAVSGLLWGAPSPERPPAGADSAGGSPDVVFVHGGAQNAHTWDTVILALGRPALAVDLPGHGHSDWREDGAYTPADLAADIAGAVRALAPTARAVVGMSLGGLAAMELAVGHPELVRSLVMVDITPGVDARKARAVIDFVDGPQTFASFEDLLARTIEFNPTRSEASLRRGILHNALRLPDGSWRWRYDRRGHTTPRGGADAAAAEAAQEAARSALWNDFGAVGCPLLLVRGGASPVVDDDDVAEARRRRPDIEIHVVAGAGHSVQGDRPVELAALVAGWLDR